MTSILGRIFGDKPSRPIETPAPAEESAYAVAMRESDDLLARMRAAYASNDPVRQAMADLWAQRHNVPYVTSVFETVQEMNAPVARQVKGTSGK